MEFVFVVPRNVLFREFYPQGLTTFAEVDRTASTRTSTAPTLARESFDTAVERDGFFVERAYAEQRPELKQVIPYCVVACEGRILLFRRSAKGGESRLFDKHSIGIGGHINPQDCDAHGVRAHESARDRARRRNPIDAGARREIEEELTVRGSYDLRAVGLLNDDSNPVGAVHVGIVQVVDVRGSVEIRERDQLEGRLVTLDELRATLAQGANFETWSSLLIPRLDELLPQPIAVPRVPAQAGT